MLKRAAQAISPEERAALHDEVVRLNMRVAAELARRYYGRGIEAEDLTQVAYVALVKAVRRYEYAPDRDFISFAAPTIRGELRRYFRDLGWSVRPTRKVQEAQGRLRSAEEELLQRLGRAPRPSELAAHLGLDLEIVLEALTVNGCFQPSSLDATGPDGDQDLKSTLGSTESGYAEIETCATLAPLLQHLNERERIMLEMRFFQEATQAQIGEVLGVTQMQVSRLLSALMARLRDELDPAAIATPVPMGVQSP